MATKGRSADVSLIDQRATHSAVDRLCTSIAEGNTEEFVRILKRDIPSLYEAFDSNGLSPLHVAVMACRSHRKWRKMSFTLLFHRDRLRLDVNIRSRNRRMMGWTAVDFACAFNNGKAVRILQQHGCESMVTGRLGDYSHRRMLHFDMELAQIREIAFPNPLGPLPLKFECPQSIATKELFSQLPRHSNPEFVFRGLLSSQAMFQYLPVGSANEVRYCFPAYFPQQLSQDEWDGGKRCLVCAGRLLSPLTHGAESREFFLQLLAHVLSRIDHKPSVSQSVFTFHTPQVTLCRVAVVESVGIRGQHGEDIELLVSSNMPLAVSIPDACAICDHLVQFVQRLSHSAFSVGVLSSLDLRSGKPAPHVYTSAELGEARRAKASSLLHPSGREELFLNLLLDCQVESHTHEQTPIKGLIPGNPLTAGDCLMPQSVFEQAPRKPNPTIRKLHYYPPEYNWTKEVCYEAVYAHCYEDLVEHMVPEYLVPPLVTAGYLAPEEVDNMISPCIAPRPRSMFMLSRLARTLREKTDYYFFFSILREETEHCTHQRLEKSLVDTCIALEIKQLEPESEISLTPCGSHEVHPYLVHESLPNFPNLDDSYRPRTGTGGGLDSTTSGDYMGSGEQSSSAQRYGSGDSGIHSRPSTDRNNRYRVQLLETRQQNVLNKRAADFSNAPFRKMPPTPPPVTGTIGSIRTRASPEHPRRTSGDSASSSNTSLFSLSTDAESNDGIPSSKPKHLSDDTTTCTPDFTDFLRLLLALDSSPDHGHSTQLQLLPGLGRKM